MPGTGVSVSLRRRSIDNNALLFLAVGLIAGALKTAKLLNFNYSIYAEPVRLGVTAVASGQVAFRIQGQGENPTARGANFWHALMKFKEAVPARQRIWGEEKTLWTVILTDEAKEVLSVIFTNARWLFEVAERQLPLF